MKKSAVMIIAAFAMAVIAANAVYALGPGMPATPMMNPGGTPHYFGPYPNYANSPMPKGAVTNITLLSGGSGYTAPVVSILDVYSTGAGATATATVTAGVITGITITRGGSGYTAPAILITDATGAGADATATVGGVLAGGIRKFVDSLPGLGTLGANNLGQYIPVAVADAATYPGSDYYEIAVVQYKEKFHTDLNATLTRGYVQLETPSNIGVSRHIALSNPDGTPILKADGSQAIGVDNPHYLGPIIVAQRNTPVRIKFSNLLPTGTGGSLFIPADKTVMGAGAGPMDSMGMQCDPMMGMPCTNYTENRATLHLHGGYVPWISDGTPHQWTTPAGENTQYPKGVSVQYVPDMWFVNGDVVPNTVGQTTPPVAGATNDPGNGSLTFYYNNQQSARLQFYHDHSYGITRLNVYAGEAAGYLVTDQVEQDMIQGTDATGVNPTLAKVLPDIGIPLVIQDKTFVDATTIPVQDPTWAWGSTPVTPHTGDLWMPHVYMPNQNPGSVGGMNSFGRWHYGPWFWPPTAGVTHGPVQNPYYDPINTPWEPPLIPGVPSNSMAMEAFMDTPSVNGAVYPYIDVEPKAYRFRILNAANDRFFNLQLYIADPNVNTTDGRNSTEVRMVPAVPTAGFPASWPTDGRAGGAPDPATRGPDFIQIGTEGGFLPAPAVISSQPVTWNLDPTTFNFGNVEGHALLLGPAERADVIIDFSAYAGKTLILYNDAPAAFPAIDPRYDYYTGNPDNTDTGGTPPTQPGYGPNIRTVMQIRVKNIAAAAPYDVAALQSVFAKTAAKSGVFEISQDPIIMPQADYNTAYDKSFPADTFVRIDQSVKTFQTISGATPTITLQQKAIQDEMGEAFEVEYGRMSGMLGLELPSTVAGKQNFMIYGYASPPVDIIVDSVTSGEPSPGDGTQIWKITHNGVDTHTLHFHLFNAQLINRVAWDNSVSAPDPNELGWKETVRVNPLEETVVALRPVAPTQPFEIPNSIRLLDPTMPEGAALVTPPGGFIDPTGQPVDVVNHLVNYGWEYVMHCHLLGHEEMDMMHGVAFVAAPKAPTGLAAVLQGNTSQLSWTDNSIIDTNFTIQRAGNAAGPWVSIAMLPGTGTTGTLAYNDTTAVQPNNHTYYYRVVANNVVGDTTAYAAPAAGFPSVSANSNPSNVVSVGSGVSCQTGADTDGDGTVSMMEILSYVQGWKQATVGMIDLLRAIGFWKAGAGC